MVDTRYYSPAQAAEVLGVDVEQVLGWIREGALVASNVASSRATLRPRWRISESDLGRFLLARRNVRSFEETKPKREIQRPAKKYV